MTNDGTWTYTWEHGRELAAMSSGGTTWNFTYDADGMRTKRTTGSSTYTYTYIGGQLTYMSVNGQDVYITHDASGQPMTINYGGTTYYYATNLQGDVTAIVNTSGTAVVTYTYDAWGNILSTGGTMASTLGAVNPLRYRGYVYDPETGLYYLQSRYYNPALGRFINADLFVSTGLGLLGTNMFSYCHNSPVFLVDSSGEYPVAATTEPSTTRLPKSFKGKNHSNYDEDDLFSTHTFTYSKISKSQANMFYEEIKQNDFEEQLAPLPISAFLSSLLPGKYGKKYGDSLSTIFDVFLAIQDMQYSDYYDPDGNLLYLEEGYTVYTVVRVFIGDGYSASETEYFIYDQNMKLVYNDVRSTSYMVD